MENPEEYRERGDYFNAARSATGSGGGSNTNKAHNVVSYAKLKEQYRVSELANDAVDNITQTGKLPSNYITKSQARARGWLEGRIWYEADVGIDYMMS